MRPRLALAGLVLALVVLALPAMASPPPSQPWKVLTGDSQAGTALSLDFDGKGETLLVGTTAISSGQGPPITLPGTGPPAGSDLLAIRYDAGNVTTAPPEGGRPAVALSKDGKYALTVGNGTTADVFYYAMPDLSAPVWSRDRPGIMAAAAISEDGSVAVVGSQAEGGQPGRVFRFTGSGQELWNRPVDRCGDQGGVGGGSVLDLDLSDNGVWLVVGTTFENAERAGNGCVLLFDARTLTPVSSFPILAGDGAVTAVDVSPDGKWYAVGTAGGRFFLFENTASGRSSPVQEQLNTLSPVVAIRTLDAGRLLVVADGSTVVRYTHQDASMRLEWTAPTPGLRSLDTTPDGNFTIAGANEMVAFYRGSNRALWNVSLPQALVRIVQLSPTDIRIAAASGSIVQAFHLHWDFAVAKVDPEPIALDPGRTRGVELRLTNTGSGVDTVRLTAPGSPQFNATFTPTSLVLLPGETAPVTLALAPRPTAEAGFYRLELSARTELGGAGVSVPLNVTVGSVPALSIAVAEGGRRDFSAFQGEAFDILLLVHNTGNDRIELAYDLTQRPNLGKPWVASLSTTSGRVEARGESTNTLHVEVPANAANGTENVFAVNARGGPVSANLTVRVVVNPQFTGSLRVIPASKVVEPGRSVTFEVVAANNGTLRDRYQLVYCAALRDLIPCLGNATKGLGGWGVAVDTQPFLLEPGSSRNTELNVHAPRVAIPGVDKLVLQVELVSADPEHRFRDFALVTTSTIEPLPPPQKPSPGFEGLAALGVAVAVAWAARRRA